MIFWKKVRRFTLISLILIIIGSFLFIGILIVLRKSLRGYTEIDKKYGKPNDAKLIKMIGGHPQLKHGSTAITFHSGDAIAFNRKVFPLSQINDIKIVAELPRKLNHHREYHTSSSETEKFIGLTVRDELGEHELYFSADVDFETIANKLIQTWKKYNLLS
jgi:hypothetical protein